MERQNIQVNKNGEATEYTGKKESIRPQNTQVKKKGEATECTGKKDGEATEYTG
jgi:hypothetical protein